MKGFLPHYLNRLMNVLNLRLLEHLRALDLTTAQFRVMQILDSRTEASIGEIALDTAVEQPIVSRLVDQLESRGYAVRTRRKGNARIVDVSLTASGQEIYRNLVPIAHAIVEDAFSVLSAAEQSLLEEMLKRVFAHIVAPRFPAHIQQDLAGR